MKNYFLKSIFLSLICLFMLSSHLAFAQGGPVDLLQSLADRMIQALKSNKATLKTNPSLVYSLAYKIVVPHADLDEMSQRVIPPRVWMQSSDSQKSRFKREFTTLLVRTYASALADYTDETVRFFPLRGGVDGKNNVVVNSQIVRSNGPSIAVTYRLLMKSGEWRLYDMTVEGVSLLQSFRSQFAATLSRGTMEDLIHQLETHNSSRGG